MRDLVNLHVWKGLSNGDVLRCTEKHRMRLAAFAVEKTYFA